MKKMTCEEFKKIVKEMDFSKHHYCKHDGCIQDFIKNDDSRFEKWVSVVYEGKCPYCNHSYAEEDLLHESIHNKEYYKQKSKELSSSLNKPISEEDVIREEIFRTPDFNDFGKLFDYTSSKGYNLIRIAPYIFKKRLLMIECPNCHQDCGSHVEGLELLIDSYKFKKRGIPMPAQHNYLKCNKCGTKWVDKWWDYDVELQKKQ